MRWYSSYDNKYDNYHNRPYMTEDDIANQEKTREANYYNNPNGYQNTYPTNYSNPYQRGNPYGNYSGMPVQQMGGQPTNPKPMAQGTFNQEGYNQGAGMAQKVGGAINPVIGGIIGAGDAIGKPIKENSEQTNPETGLIENRQKARNSAIIGSFFSPSKAISARSSYKGGWTDFSGKKYVDSLDGGQDAYNKRMKAYRDEQTRANNAVYFANMKNTYQQRKQVQSQNQYAVQNIYY